MADKTVKETIKASAVNVALNYLDKDPEKNLPKLLDWVDRFDRGDMFLSFRKLFREVLDDPDNNWYQLMMSLWNDVDTDVRKTTFKNFIVNSALIGLPRGDAYREKYQCNIPWAILLDPTTACNLHCIGCWAAEYGKNTNMDYATLSDIVRQGKKMGTYMYIFTGGEPLVRKKDIIRLCEEHSDCQFLSFTNGTLIDDAFAEEMLRVKNFVPAISVEGFGEATDSRRGEGTYDKVIAAMEILRRHKLPFGVSCCYTRTNTEVIGSEAYIDDLIAKGAKFAWFFTYMPVGKDAVPELLATDEQRKFMYHQIRKFRKTKPIFTMDFWNDGEYVRGCIAGGRNYLHINAAGDIEPCAFIHYSDSNIYDKTLLEAYQSPLFMAYKEGQPFNDNMLRPCPLLDNYGALAKMVDTSGAHSTDMESPEDVHDLCDKCKAVSEKWAETADALWEENPHWNRTEREFKY
ncbi:radical SAM protein [Eubacterium barkeri]|uniref:Radical SAM superfamily enzyme, MoaA/NifB/PqqE/SkfB family n=1 Tax=Eubacterium barkeri TaxID=1528 RepID=A0A1H3FPC0_EUBBA|nr:radical SAM protein [Eubacterium barkeri]SDX92228.1 Radical SAM superfamily enzyme, MoaA/NifB/PqqE/SkfB family [Eubacterium barkeri]